ncbi:hypothetical protein BASA61_002066 [Batrachochytrium salamandrivorans]|nr:hypothetical protein BASA61_002066 [Batrachochytrium salamandrivorans]
MSSCDVGVPRIGGRLLQETTTSASTEEFPHIGWSAIRSVARDMMAAYGGINHEAAGLSLDLLLEWD